MRGRAVEVADPAVVRQPLSWSRTLLLLAAGLGMAVDISEVALSAVLATVFASPGKPAAAGLTWLLTALPLGAVIGAPVAGWAADRFGKAPVLALALLAMALTSTLCAFAPDMATLAACRFLCGLAVGAFPPVMIALLADRLPPQTSQRLAVVVTGLASIGPLLLVLLIRALELTPVAPLQGWRWGLLIVAVAALVAAALFGLVAMRAEPLPLQRPVVVSAVAERLVWRRLAPLFLIFFLSPWATSAFPMLNGALAVRRGFQVDQGLLLVALTGAGPILAVALAPFVLGRGRPTNTLAALGLAMILIALLFAGTSNKIVLMSTALSYGVCMQLYLPNLLLLAAQSAPNGARALFTASLWSANRIGTILVPLSLIGVLNNWGPLATVVAISVAIGAALPLLILFGRLVDAPAHGPHHG